MAESEVELKRRWSDASMESSVIGRPYPGAIPLWLRSVEEAKDEDEEVGRKCMDIIIEMRHRFENPWPEFANSILESPFFVPSYP
ncbi:hypothetical protein L1887_23054 [Cichorium endivia]|nr:hypothetical protein L1887_23054 [Cichorium endivia]